MNKLLCTLGLMAGFTLTHANAASTINATNNSAWGANIGWTNWLPSAADGVVVGEFICTGYVWGANVGWINLGSGFTPSAGHVQYSNLSATDFGVNYGIDPTQPGVAILRGYAYGANIGWINFEATGNPRLSLFTGAFSGYAYSANCGWINLNDALGKVQTDHVAMGVDSDGDGMADAFEFKYFGGLSHAATTDTDGDGITDLQEYLEGTDPNVANDRLRITMYAIAPNLPSSQDSQITWASTVSRLYTIETNTDLLNPLNWVDSGLGTFAPTAGTATTRTVTLPTATKRFFRVKSIRPLP